MKKKSGNKGSLPTDRSKQGGMQRRPSAVKRQPVTRSHMRKKAPLFATDVTPFIMFAIALLAETCLVLGSHAGAAGEAVKGVLYGLFGPVSHAIAICVLVLAFFYTDLKSYGTLCYKLIMASSFMLVLAATYSLIAQNGMNETAFSFPEFFESGKLGESGGAVGSFFGFIFSRILTGAVAAVIFTVASFVLLTFCLGRSHIGIWKAFFRYEHTPSVKPAEAKLNKKVPDVSPTVTRIDTLISTESARTSVDAIGPSTDIPLVGDGEEDVDDIGEFFDDPASDTVTPAQSGGFDVLGFDITEGEHTVKTVDFGEEQHLRENYRPTDLMTDFGFGDEKYGERPAKPDVYDETPKKPERKPYVPPKRIDMGSPNAYSPFANPLMSFDDFKKHNQNGSSYRTADGSVKNGGAAYSPFSDPVRSMNAPKRNEEIAPQLYIATDSTDKWEETKRTLNQDQAPENELEIPAPEEVIAQPQADADDEEDDIPFAPVLTPIAPKPEPVRTPAFAPVPAASPVKTVAEKTDSFGIPTVASDAPQKVASTFEEEPVPAPVYVPTPEPAPAPAPVIEHVAPEKPAAAQKVDIHSISALQGNTQIDDAVATPEAAQTQYEEPDDEEYEEEQRGINFYTYKHKRYPNYVAPTIDLLDPPAPPQVMSEEEIYDIQNKLLEKLASFKVEASLSGYSIGPSITRYELMPGPGVKSKQIIGLSEDIGLALQSEVRIFTVPDKAVIGVEVPNKKASKVSLRSLIDNPDFMGAKSKITVCVGVTVSGKPIYMNIDDMPHVLVAGQTKSGKSVAINCMLISLVYRASPDEVQLILIDPKRVELSIYSDLPHMVMPVIDDPKRAAAALKWAVAEMERRYQLLSDMRVRNRDEYYALKDENPNFEYMPQIVIVIDELADLMLQVREHVEELINRLAAMARACGIHLIIGTQRPSADIVTGLIKANIPSRIAFKVANQVDSRIILGSVGAEKLLGRGDMLYYPTGSNQVRAQGAFVDTPEIKRILKFMTDHNGGPQYNPEILYALQTETDKLNKTGNSGKKSDEEMDDVAIDSSDIDFDYICKATELVINLGKATTNVIQRHLKVGFNKAANITDQLEELGFISKSQGSSRPREVLVTMQQFLEWKNANQR